MKKKTLVDDSSIFEKAKIPKKELVKTGIITKLGTKVSLRTLWVCLLELEDELKWDTLYKKTQPGLIAAAQKARQEIAEGLSKPLDFDDL